MKRKIELFLIEWKNRPDRLPLLIYGARQIGKTYSIRKFAEKYFPDCLYMNFEEDSDLAGLFDAKIDAKHCLHQLELYYARKIIPGETLLFFDEIQICERALTALKYFAEEAPEIPVIASGSLLGVMIKRRKSSFPVGKVTIRHMATMDFEEFLWAAGEDMLAQEIRNTFENLAPLPDPIHRKALELSDLYLFLGGMPAVLNAYFPDKNIAYADEKKNDLLNAYLADIAKYASPDETSRIIGAFKSIPMQLAKENHKFQYKIIQKGASASLFGPSLDWLETAGIIIRCHRLDQPVLPLTSNYDVSAFKVYMQDCGLLAKMMGIKAGDILLPRLDSSFRGAIAENYTAAALRQNFDRIYYWESKSQAEVDFIIQQDSQVIPIEVKSGTNTRSRSLQSYRERYNPEYVVRISRSHFGSENMIRSIPVYAVFCLTEST